MMTLFVLVGLTLMCATFYIIQVRGERDKAEEQKEAAVKMTNEALDAVEAAKKPYLELLERMKEAVPVKAEEVENKFKDIFGEKP